MKNSILKRMMLGTVLAATLSMSFASVVNAFPRSIDGTKLALNDSKEDVILLKGDISLTDKDEKVSLSLRDSDVEQVLRMFADIAGLNIVFYDKVSSKITLDIVDTPVSDAFDMVMEISQLTYSIINGNTLVIAKSGSDIGMLKQGITFIPLKYVGATTMANFINKNVFGLQKPGLSGSDIVITNPGTNELMVFGTENDVTMVKKIIEKFDKQPTFTTFKTNFTTPKEMTDMICKVLFPTIIDESALLPVTNGIRTANGGFITGGASSLELGATEVACSFKGSVSAGNISSIDSKGLTITYQNQNGIINMIGGSPEQIALVEDFIKQHDRKIPQAYLEVSVIELNEIGSKELTNTWNFYSDVFSFNTSGGNFGSTLPIWLFGNTAIKEVKDGVPVYMERDGRPSGVSLQYSIQYALSNSKARTVANPRVLVTNGEQSSIDITSSYIESTESEAVSTSSGTILARKYNVADDAGVKVSITPFISPDGYVTMNVSTSYTVTDTPITTKDELGNTNIEQTPTHSRSFDLTNLRIKDGETIVIAGMIQEIDTKTVTKIPGLGDIPYLGALFRSSNTSKSKSEMLVMITPKIIYDDEDL